MAASPSCLAHHIGTERRAGIGKIRSTPIKLNSKWAKAMLKAASVCERAAINAVKVVPMFAPIKKGKALLIDILLVATNGTIKDEVTELDCTAAVRPIPHDNDRKGLLKTTCSIFFR